MVRELHSKKKRKRVEVEVQVDTKENQNELYLGNVIKKAKEEMQSATSMNGITYVVYGSSGSGKTTLMRKILVDYVYGENAEKEYIVVYCTTSKHADALEDMDDKRVIICNVGTFPDLFHWAYTMNMQYGKQYNFVFIMDDCIHLKGGALQQMIENCMLTFRNSNVTTLICIQYPNLIPKPIRTSAYITIGMKGKGSWEMGVMVACWAKSSKGGVRFPDFLIPFFV